MLKVKVANRTLPCTFVVLRYQPTGIQHYTVTRSRTYTHTNLHTNMYTRIRWVMTRWGPSWGDHFRYQGRVQETRGCTCVRTDQNSSTSGHAGRQGMRDERGRPTGARRQGRTRGVLLICCRRRAGEQRASWEAAAGRCYPRRFHLLMVKLSTQALSFFRLLIRFSGARGKRRGFSTPEPIRKMSSKTQLFFHFSDFRQFRLYRLYTPVYTG